MTLSSLTPDELAVVERALQLMATGDVLWGKEFYARVGVPFDEFQQLVADWPNLDDTDDDSATSVAINNTLNDLLNGVGMSDEEVRQRLGTTRDDARRILDKYRAARGWDS